MTAVALRISGDLASRSAEHWICHRACLLSLEGWVRRENDNLITVVLKGPEPLIDAMEVACSLGPGDVLVDAISRQEHHNASVPSGFQIAQ
ncbi:MAG: acylphosphatase [Pseudomonadota bacterium]